MEEKKILVFGAAGFIGTYLIDELLQQNNRITAADISLSAANYYNKKNIPFFQIDITDYTAFEKLYTEKFDIVIHLAACQPANVSEKNYDPKAYINVNVNGTLNILDFCLKAKVGKIIYATSHRNTQGHWLHKKLIKEDDGRSIKYSGQYSLFSISESAAQDCILHYQEQFGLKSIIFRLPPVYGYGPHTEIYMDGKPIKTGFQIFIENAAACKPLEVWGDSSKGRDIVYIKDVTKAFLKAIENETATGLFNISSGKALSLYDEASTIAKIFWGDESEPIVYLKPEKPNNIDSFVYDISRALTVLDWKPLFGFEEMLIDYIKEEKTSRFDFLVEKRKQMFSEDSKI